jgi:DNA-binding FadR family transcriptional regulator
MSSPSQSGARSRFPFPSTNRRCKCSFLYEPRTVLPNKPTRASELSVSRNALRAAVKVRISKDLVEVRPKTGTKALPRRPLMRAKVRRAEQMRHGPIHLQNRTSS